MIWERKFSFSIVYFLSLLFIWSTSCKSKESVISLNSVVYQDISGAKHGVLQQEWLKIFLNKLAQNGGKSNERAKGIGLFSYSGWANVGQRFVIIRGNQDWDWFYAGVGGESIELMREFKADQEKDILDSFLKLNGILDVNSGVFDGIQYEVIIAEKEKDEIKIIKRAFLNNPDMAQEGKEQGNLIKKVLQLEKTLVSSDSSKK